ncbi:dual oxidase 2-like, partial [Saccoglossus kowalevskii]
MDILREVEQEDHNNIIDVHIFITQFYQKFDLRTTMLYICERHFQTIAKKSLFTGLQAITHFGRPEFHSLLGSISDSLMQEHQ